MNHFVQHKEAMGNSQTQFGWEKQKIRRRGTVVCTVAIIVVVTIALARYLDGQQGNRKKEN